MMNKRFYLKNFFPQLNIFQLYKKQAQELNFGEHHLHLRSVPFEFASYQNIKKMESTFMTTVVEDDSNLDR